MTRRTPQCVMMEPPASLIRACRQADNRQLQVELLARSEHGGSGMVPSRASYLLFEVVGLVIPSERHCLAAPRKDGTRVTLHIRRSARKVQAMRHGQLGALAKRSSMHDKCMPAATHCIGYG